MAYGLWRMSDNPSESTLTFPYAPIQICAVFPDVLCCLSGALPWCLAPCGRYV